MNRLIHAAQVTGAGVAILNHGKVVYFKAYGLRDTEKNLPLTRDSVMTGASLTKSAFATVVMRASSSVARSILTRRLSSTSASLSAISHVTPT